MEREKDFTDIKWEGNNVLLLDQKDMECINILLNMQIF